MALKKLCSCNKVIDYNLRMCPDCEVKYKINKKENDRIYDTTCRSKESKDIYNSGEWKRLTQQCKVKFNGLDIYSYYILGQIEYGTISHHIEEIEKNKNRIYDIDNLFYCSTSNHNIFHGMYNTDYEGTKKMLFELINRWMQQFII